MARRIAIIQCHPDPTRHHLLHALGDAYAEGAIRAGREVRRAEVAKLEFPLLRTQEDFESGTVPPALAGPQDDMRWAEHWVFVFPLWHGTMPALLKGFLEHIFRPGFAMDYAKNDAGDGLSVVFWRLRDTQLRARHVEIRGGQADPREPLWLGLC